MVSTIEGEILRFIIAHNIVLDKIILINSLFAVTMKIIGGVGLIRQGNLAK